MKFGFTLKPDMPVDRIVSLTRQAETAGFEYGWMFDSHVLWMECFPLMTLMVTNAKRMKIGPCVTNPAVRDITVMTSLFATLDIISGRRMQLGIGRGDSSRRVLGKKPVTPKELEQAIATYRDLASGKEIDYEGQKTKITWSPGPAPVWIAGYGPKVLASAGRVADGVILQFADPDLIEWCVGFVHQGAKEVGRDPKSIEIMAAAPVWISDDLETAREHVRWFPALVSNHVIELISKYDPRDLPPALTSYVQNRGSYDYRHHCEVGSNNADFVTDDVVDRFCIVGNVDAQVNKLRRLQQSGVTQFNIYLMCGDEEKTLDQYRDEVMPAFAKQALEIGNRP
jgi:probable F420-dependent oxidoreductase